MTIEQDKNEKFPEFPGGDDSLYTFIQNNLKYPKDAYLHKIEGLVVVEFVIDTAGNVSDIKILKGINNELDKEATRVVGLMNKWRPAEQNGEKVKVSLSLPISFEINRHTKKRI